MLSASSTTLCSGCRTGTLCGGCLPNFTQSMDGVSCISNDECGRDLWWVWMLSVLGFVVIGLIITPRSEQSDGLLSCLLFYLQIASFASSLNDSSGSNAIPEYSQVRSVVALFARSCYARNMSAYDAAAARLVGPLFVLVFSLAWTWLLRVLQQRGTSVQVSYVGTAVSAVLYVFSSAATVVFTLVECTNYADSGSSVVFIDGTVPCFDGRQGPGRCCRYAVPVSRGVSSCAPAQQAASQRSSCLLSPVHRAHVLLGRSDARVPPADVADAVSSSGLPQPPGVCAVVPRTRHADATWLYSALQI